ncbi:response regulator [Streptomyces rubrogriseus]|uniref:Response regulator transcription factor n=1 Tax=Streptomyces rubrogriseus TaxID=194673 RepID=A0A6G3TDI0_9ACTN|nr:response regulator transcription factor [Streptomyces rubrogriseus]NEC34799.1 response regulator transcription factor [Streptomyces rubrogriseus]
MTARDASRPPTVLICDDHPVVRCGIRTLLDDDRHLIVGEAADLAGTVDQVKRHRPTVLLLDLSFLGTLSLGILPTVRAVSPNTRVLILTMHNDPASARRSLAAGAHGFLPKDAAAEELVAAVDTLVGGGRYLHPALGAALFDHRTDPDSPLSGREREVLGLIADGLTHRQIADELGLSVRTIEAQRASIKVKLGVSRRAELITHARRLRLVTTGGDR